MIVCVFLLPHVRLFNHSHAGWMFHVEMSRSLVSGRVSDHISGLAPHRFVATSFASHCKHVKALSLSPPFATRGSHRLAVLPSRCIGCSMLGRHVCSCDERGLPRTADECGTAVASVFPRESRDLCTWAKSEAHDAVAKCEGGKKKFSSDFPVSRSL
jgi:hypothetical protein